MPVPVEKLVEAQRPLDERILDFLRNDPTQAYTLGEIQAAVEGWQTEMVALAALFVGRERYAAALEPYRRALRALHQAGRVQAAEVQGVQHFALTQ